MFVCPLHMPRRQRSRRKNEGTKGLFGRRRRLDSRVFEIQATVMCRKNESRGTNPPATPRHIEPPLTSRQWRQRA